MSLLAGDGDVIAQIESAWIGAATVPAWLEGRVQRHIPRSSPHITLHATAAVEAVHDFGLKRE